MIKIYTYKDGTKAFFEKNERVMINDDEIKALLIRDFKNYYSADTAIAKYLEHHCDGRFLNILLTEYRSGQYTSKTFNLPDGGSIDAVYKDGELVAMDVMVGFGEEFEYVAKGSPKFDEYLKKYETILLPTKQTPAFSNMKDSDSEYEYTADDKQVVLIG